MPLLLELFSGTGSLGKAFRELGWDVFSVDNDPKAKASLCKNIMDVTPDDLPEKIDFLWASPLALSSQLLEQGQGCPEILRAAMHLCRERSTSSGSTRGFPG